MRTIAVSLLLAVAAFASASPQSTLAELATDFSTGDAPGAIALFDSQMPGYGAIANNIQALADQAEITCAIEILSDTESAGVHTLELDWIMNLKSMGDGVSLERRREQVRVEMRQIKGKWKITALAPLSILNPIHIV